MTIIKAQDASPIDVSEYIGQINQNLQDKSRNPFEQTPIGKKADGSYFWWIDEGDFIDLDKRSVKALLAYLKKLKT